MKFYNETAQYNFKDPIFIFNFQKEEEQHPQQQQ